MMRFGSRGTKGLLLSFDKEGFSSKVSFVFFWGGLLADDPCPSFFTLFNRLIFSLVEHVVGYNAGAASFRKPLSLFLTLPTS